MTVLALRQRRPAVLEDLLAAYGKEIQAVAYLIVRDRADAEDVVVETLVAALEHGSELREEAALRSWLLRIATNKALSIRRHTARVVRLETVPEGSSRSHENDSLMRAVLIDGVNTLPPRMKAAIVLRYYADLSVEECARALGKSPNTVKAQLQEGLERLRSALADASGGASQKALEARNV